MNTSSSSSIGKQGDKFISIETSDQILPSTCSSMSLCNSSIFYDANQQIMTSSQTNQLSTDLNKISLSGGDKENENLIQQKFNASSTKSSVISQDTSDYSSVKYGELIVLGYNGCISSTLLNESNKLSNDINNNSNVNRRKSKYILKSREKANGVRPSTQHIVQSSQEADNLVLKNPNHSVTYTLSRNQTVVVQYVRDDKTDMFQIGRSMESAIDFVVLDTVIPTVSSQQQQQQQQSTISRFACRIVVDREYPYTARIYAAGFDSSKRIFLGEKASKWRNEKGELDGVTTNGVLIMHPSHGFTSSHSDTSEWMEVSVCGAVFKLNEARSINNNKPTSPDHQANNVLRDGTLIDLCGATLMWRGATSLQQTPTKHYLDLNLEHLNKIRPQCPVGLKTLVFPSSASPAHNSNTSFYFPKPNDPNTNQQRVLNPKRLGDRMPMVYLKCGHVHGHHDWGVKKDNERECPLCRKVGPYVQLIIGLEPSLYCDTDLADEKTNTINFFKPYAFRPCGHMASEKTCKYWSRIMVPQGATQGLSPICPFCSVGLCKEQPYVRLIFQEGFLMH